MRLSAERANAIKAAAHQAFGPSAVVRLFGSRARGRDPVTRDEAQEATGEAAQAAERWAAHPARLHARTASWFPLTVTTSSRWGADERERRHALLRMFDRLYDLTTRPLSRGWLFLSGTTLDGLSARDRFHRGAHDYPTRPGKQAERANLAWTDIPHLIAGNHQTISLLRSEGLIP